MGAKRAQRVEGRNGKGIGITRAASGASLAPPVAQIVAILTKGLTMGIRMDTYRL